jgi:transposase
VILNLPPSVQLSVCTEPTDMRKSFDGLAALVEHVLEQDPLSGHLFCFFNRRGDRCKILWYDHGGYALFCKRLERGRFRVPVAKPGQRRVAMRAVELALILEGIDLRGAKHRRVWRPREKNAA